jgi:hypothetical protein
MRDEISGLKRQISELREDLAKSVLLTRVLYQYVADADNFVGRYDKYRNEIVRLLRELKAPVQIDIT